MRQPRETYYAALFSKVSNSAGFVTKSRKLKHWTDTAPEELPALFQAQKGESVSQQKGVPAKWILHCDLYVYVHTLSQQLGDAYVTPSSLLNPLLDAIELALAPDNLADNTCTLGGLVSHCWIEGMIETSEGTLGDHEVAIIPIAILVPS